MIKIEAD